MTDVTWTKKSFNALKDRVGKNPELHRLFATLEELVRDQPLDARALHTAAREAIRAGQHQGARALLLLAVSKDPQSGPSWALLAMVQRELSGGGAKSAARALELDPDDMFVQSVAKSFSEAA